MEHIERLQSGKGLQPGQLMGLASGTKLGAYEILAPLGAGGMGEVHRARDTKLKRDVALKVLPELLARDPDRMARFQREAQVLASLNHPNIAAIYGLEESDGVRALVMELVEGPTLAQLLETRNSKVEIRKSGSGSATSFEFRSSSFDPLPIARQIAEALEYAHERGVVHRDLKPANIKITPEGGVKVLDFGLAKALDLNGRISSDDSNSPTLTIAATGTGVILGTAAYMSPEQARGKAVDRRSDIWSFGCVLFEMLTGKRLFEGETVSDTLAAVLKLEPDWDELPADTPDSIRKLVRQCLIKDPRQRLRDIGDARIAIEETIAGVRADGVRAGRERDGSQASGGERRSSLRLLPWAAAALTAALAVTAAWLFTSRRQPAERMQFAIPLGSDAESLALSADGRMLAYVARDDAAGQDVLYFERLGSAGATRLEGTEGAAYPFWSPDDTSIGFFADGKLQKIAIAGGAPQVLATASRGRGGSWGSRGVIIYAPDAGGPLWRLNVDGSGAAALTDKLYLSGESSHRWPEFLPDGEHFLYWSGSFGSGAASLKDGIYFSSLAAKEKKLVEPTEANAGYANGHLYYLDERKSLISVPFDPGDGRVTGEPVVVSDHVSYEPSVIYSAFAAGGNDTAVYSAGAGAVVLSALAWYDRSGKELGRIGGPAVVANPSISPNGNYAVADIADLKTPNVDIWIEDLGHNTASRFTFDPSEEATGVWSRDGREIAYRSDAAGSSSIEIKKASGLEAAKRVYTTAPQDDIMPNSWTLDGKSILCTFEPAAGGSDLVLVDAASGKVTPFVATQASETNGMISPDGKWVAYASNESGEWEIYATTFPGAQGKWQVSRGGGTEPRWEGDGKEIFYLDPKGMLTAVPVNTNGTFSAGAASPLFQIHGRAAISSTDFYTYDVSKDGKRFLVNRYVKPDHVEPLTVVLNATAGTNK
jgi:eukaryotic-like serine/threonine-protein kinase